MKSIAFVLLLSLGTNVGVHAQDRGETYSVIGVAKNDTLNVRSGPGETFPVVAQLPNDASGIQIDGQTVMNGSDDWVPITASGIEGWVRPKYLFKRADTIALNSDVPVRRATAVNADEAPPSNEALSSRSDTVSDDPYAWVKPVVVIVGAIAALSIINDIFNGGDSVSQNESRSSSSDSYDFDRDRQNENYKAQQKGESLPYPGVSAIQH